MFEAVAPRYNVPIQKIPPKVGAFVGKASLERRACDGHYMIIYILGAVLWGSFLCQEVEVEVLNRRGIPKQ